MNQRSPLMPVLGSSLLLGILWRVLYTSVKSLEPEPLREQVYPTPEPLGDAPRSVIRRELHYEQKDLDAPSQAHDWTNFGPTTHTGTFAHVPGRLSNSLIPPHPFVPLGDDFYALTPGNERLRLPQQIPIPGLALAGN